MARARSSDTFRLHKEHKVKIAQIAPLMESVPPRLYGGTERVVSHLCEALVQEGNDVTLFASGDFVTSRDSSLVQRRRSGSVPPFGITCPIT